MIASSLVRLVRAGLIALVFIAVAASAQAQQQPSANAIALAREIITAKASAESFESVGPSVIEQVKSMFLQTNPTLSKDLNDTAAKLRTDFTARFSQPLNDAAKLYASKFTEQELKDVLAFYRSSAGKKVIAQEPNILEQSMQNLDNWASTFSEEVIARMRGEMKKKGHDL
jgi:uncharacterized protein